MAKPKAKTKTSAAAVERNHAEVDRMLADPQAEGFVQGFARQWLKIDEISRFAPDQQIYPDFYATDMAGVDPIAVLEIQKIIRFLKSRGIGVLITDHNVRETLGICDRAYIINEGSVLACGAPQEIVQNESVRKVYLGEHFRL